MLLLLVGSTSEILAVEASRGFVVLVGEFGLFLGVVGRRGTNGILGTNGGKLLAVVVCLGGLLGGVGAGLLGGVGAGLLGGVGAGLLGGVGAGLLGGVGAGLLGGVGLGVLGVVGLGTGILLGVVGLGSGRLVVMGTLDGPV